MCIFAKQLRIVMHKHDKTLGSLYSVRIGERVIHPVQIERLKQVADGDCSKSVTLNPDEIDAIEQEFTFDAEDTLRIRAALVAESLYRLLVARIAPDKALELSEFLFEALFQPNNAALIQLQTQIIDGVRDVPTLPDEEPAARAPVERQIEEGLEPAINAYEEGVLWLNAAYSAADDMRRRGFAMLAASLLQDASELIAYPPGIAEGTIQQTSWRETIAVALSEAQQLAGIDS